MKALPLKAIIVDDESKAVRLLEDMAAPIEGIRVVASFTDPVKALLEIRSIMPDVVFLDVQMPRMSGFELLRGIRNNGLQPWVIFITAFDQYAIEAIHQEAFDYLLKPVSPKELNDSIDRIFTRIDSGGPDGSIDLLLSKISVPKLRFSDRTGIFFFAPEEIVYVEADGNYSMIIMKTKQHLVTRKIGEMEEILGSHGFIRISRSYIINPAFLVRIDRRLRICILEYLNETAELPVSEEKMKKIG